MIERAFAVIPAFNEERRVADVVDVVRSAESALVDPNYIVVVDNNSSDNTRQRAEAAGATVLTCERQGKGWAMKTGAEYVRELGAKAVMFLDADLAGLKSEDISHLAEYVIDEQFLMSIGYLGGRKPIIKRKLENWGALSGQRVVGWEAWDALRGHDFKGWRIEGALNTVFRNAGRGNEITRMELRGTTHIGQNEKQGSYRAGGIQYTRIYLSALRGLMTSSSL